MIVITQLRDTLAWLERAERTGAPLFTTNIGLVESGKRWVKKFPPVTHNYATHHASCERYTSSAHKRTHAIVYAAQAR